MKSLLTAAFVLSIAGSAHAQLSPFNAAGITYGHVHLNVKDIELQKKLWVDHFDGVVVQKGPLTAIKLVRSPAQASIAVAPASLNVPWHSIVCGPPTRVIAGAVVSTTCTRRLAVAVLP